MSHVLLYFKCLTTKYIGSRIITKQSKARSGQQSKCIAIWCNFLVHRKMTCVLSSSRVYFQQVSGAAYSHSQYSSKLLTFFVIYNCDLFVIHNCNLLSLTIMTFCCSQLWPFLLLTIATFFGIYNCDLYVIHNFSSINSIATPCFDCLIQTIPVVKKIYWELIEIYVIHSSKNHPTSSDSTSKMRNSKWSHFLFDRRSYFFTQDLL